MSKKKAREDVRILLNYIRNRTGLLVEKGQDEKKKKLFSFAHLSLNKYLCAYRIAKDKSKSKMELISDLLYYMEYPSWHESILLALYLFEKSTGTSFIDAFISAAFKKFNRGNHCNSWFLLGKAVRDNIDIAPADIKLIIDKVFNIYVERMEENEGNIAFSILNQIALFSQQGRNILKKYLRKKISDNNTQKWPEAKYLYKKIFNPSRCEQPMK